MVISPIDALALTNRITPERESIISLKSQGGAKLQAQHPVILCVLCIGENRVSGNSDLYIDDLQLQTFRSMTFFLNFPMIRKEGFQREWPALMHHKIAY